MRLLRDFIPDPPLEYFGIVGFRVFGKSYTLGGPIHAHDRSLLGGLQKTLLQWV